MPIESTYRFLAELDGSQVPQQARELAEQIDKIFSKTALGGIAEQVSNLAQMEHILSMKLKDVLPLISSQSRRMAWKIKRVRELSGVLDTLIQKEAALATVLSGAIQSEDPFGALVVSAQNAATQIVGRSIIPEMTREVISQLRSMKDTAGESFDWFPEAAQGTAALAQIYRAVSMVRKELLRLKAEEPLFNILDKYVRGVELRTAPSYFVKDRWAGMHLGAERLIALSLTETAAATGAPGAPYWLMPVQGATLLETVLHELGHAWLAMAEDVGAASTEFIVANVQMAFSAELMGKWLQAYRTAKLQVALPMQRAMTGVEIWEGLEGLKYPRGDRLRIEAIGEVFASKFAEHWLRMIETGQVGLLGKLATAYEERARFQERVGYIPAGYRRERWEDLLTAAERAESRAIDSKIYTILGRLERSTDKWSRFFTHLTGLTRMAVQGTISIREIEYPGWAGVGRDFPGFGGRDWEAQRRLSVEALPQLPGPTVGGFRAGEWYARAAAEQRGYGRLALEDKLEAELAQRRLEDRQKGQTGGAILVRGEWVDAETREPIAGGGRAPPRGGGGGRGRRGRRPFWERWTGPEQGDISRVELFARALNMAAFQYYGLRRLGYQMVSIGQSAKRMGLGVLDWSKDAAEGYLEFNKAVTQAGAAMELPPELMAKLEAETLAASRTLGLFPAEEIAEGLFYWVSGTGEAIKTEQQLQRVVQDTIGIQKLAAMNNVRLADTTLYAGAALKEFGLPLSELPHVLEVLNYVAAKTFSTVDDVGTAFKYVGPIAASMGISFEETAVVLGMLSDANIRASMAGRGLRQLLISISDPTAEFNDIMNRTLGLSGMLGDAWQDLAFEGPEQQFVGLAGFIDLVAAATENLTVKQRANTLAILATANELPVLTTLVEMQIDARKENVNIIRAQQKLVAGIIDEEVLKYQEIVEAHTGITQSLQSAHQLWIDMWSTWERSLGIRADRARRKWEAVMKEFGKAVTVEALPAIEAAMSVFTKIIHLVSQNPWMVRAILGGAVAMATIGQAVIMIGKLIEFYAAFKTIQQARNLYNMAAAQMNVQASNVMMQAAILQVRAAGGRAVEWVRGAPAAAAGAAPGVIATILSWISKLLPVLGLWVLAEAQVGARERRIGELYVEELALKGVPTEIFPPEVIAEFQKRYAWAPGGPAAGPTMYAMRREYYEDLSEEERQALVFQEQYLENVDALEGVLRDIALEAGYTTREFEAWVSETDEAAGALKDVVAAAVDLSRVWPPWWLPEEWDAVLREYRDYLDDLEDMDEDYQRDRERRFEDHTGKLEDLIAKRDVKGLQKEIREFEKREAREEEDYHDRRTELEEDARERLGEMVGYYSTEEEYYRQHIDTMIEEFQRFVEAQEGFWAEYPKAFPVVPAEYLESVAAQQLAKFQEVIPWAITFEPGEAQEDIFAKMVEAHRAYTAPEEAFGPEYVGAMKSMQEAWMAGILASFGPTPVQFPVLRQELAGAPGQVVVSVDQRGWHFQGSFSAADREAMKQDVHNAALDALGEVFGGVTILP